MKGEYIFFILSSHLFTFRVLIMKHKQYFSNIRPKVYSVISFLVAVAILVVACSILSLALISDKVMQIVTSEYLLFPYLGVWLLAFGYLAKAYRFLKRDKWLIAEVGDMGIYYETMFHRIRYIYYSQIRSIDLDKDGRVLVVLKNGKNMKIPIPLPANELKEFVSLAKELV